LIDLGMPMDAARLRLQSWERQNMRRNLYAFSDQKFPITCRYWSCCSCCSCVGAPFFEIVQGSVVSKQTRMKFGRNVLQQNMRRLTVCRVFDMTSQGHESFNAEKYCQLVNALWLSPKDFEILRLKYMWFTVLSFLGHVTSSVTWSFSSR